jgi:hypothetical protein
MSTWNTVTRAQRPRLVDRLFVGACTGAYLVLLGAVLAALKLYGG